MQGRQSKTLILSKAFGYLFSVGTFLIGSVVDVVILLFTDFYTPACGILVMLYNFYRVFSHKIISYTPPKGSIHKRVSEEERPELYEMLAINSPKGSELNIYRSIGLEHEYVASIEKGVTIVYIEEDYFLKTDQNRNTRAVGFSYIMFDAPQEALIKRMCTDIGWLDQLSSFMDSTNDKLKKENDQIKNQTAKAAIVGGILGGGAGALIAGGSVGATRAGMRGPLVLLLLPTLVYALYLLAGCILMIPFFIAICFPLRKKTDQVLKGTLGKTPQEIEQNWKRGIAECEDEERQVLINPDDSFYLPENGWRPIYANDDAPEVVEDEQPQAT